MSIERDRRVTVVIITYNSGATLGRCLDCLDAQTRRDFNVIVVDNASASRPTASLLKRPFPVSYMEMAHNLGFAGGMNIALQAAQTPYLAALNPDAFAASDWLEKLVKAADRHPEIAAFGSWQRRYGDPTAIDGFGDHYLFSGQAWRGHRLPPPPPTPGPEYTFGVCAAAALYRTEIVRAIGGFDDRYFCFYEDVDLSFRLRLAGHHCAVIRAAVVDHVGGASFTGLSDFAERLTARNEWWTLVKNMPFGLFVVGAAGYLAIQLISAMRSGRAARLAGVREGLTRTGEFWRSRRDVQRQRKLSVLDLSRWLTWQPRAFLRKESPTRSVRSIRG